MKKLCQVIIIAVALLSSLMTQAQDPHVSQFYDTPNFLNPGFTGRFDGSLRLQGSYRQQWLSLGTPYTTSFAAADFRMGGIGVGFTFTNDAVAEGGLNHTNALLGLSYAKDFGHFGKISFGLQTGLVQKSFDPTKLQFDSQYDPDIGFDPDLPSGEIFPTQQLSRADLSVGMAYLYEPIDPFGIKKLALGLSASHINEPNFSFLGGEAPLPMKLAAYGKISLITSERVVINPSILFMRQGTAQELHGALTLDYEQDREVFLHAGVGYRHNDAVIPQVGITFNYLHIGLSYDLTLSTLGQYNKLRGGYELNLAYTFQKNNAPKIPRTKIPRTKIPRQRNKTIRPQQSIYDTDGDGIVDHKDNCPELPGLKRYRGCPDSDGDGLIDPEDDCPTMAGPVERQGCPAMDRDGDGIIDRVDLCPDVPGMVAFRGCPDSDHDGLPDNVDKCPSLPGPRDRSGCPASDIDADGDGIPDKIDLCPTVAGLVQHQGCPDSDNDGVTDFKDQCPLLKGTIDNYGCPGQNQDADGDGILDIQDSCPYVPGILQFAGCPDTDTDGIPDLQDRCPMVFGPRTNGGCPIGTQAMNVLAPTVNPCNQCPASTQMIVQPQHSLLQVPNGQINGSTLIGGFPQFGPVEFDTDQAIIKIKYFNMLNSLADYMARSPEVRLLISGHTDNEGTAAYNMILGQNRSLAIKNYLLGKGISKKQISIMSYGEIMPKTTNNTTDGKARNRRTELILVPK